MAPEISANRVLAVEPTSEGGAFGRRYVDKLPEEDLEELESDEPSRTEEEEFRILAELDTDPEELSDP